MRPSSFIVSVVSIVCAIDRVEYKGFLLSIYTTEVKVAGNDFGIFRRQLSGLG